MGNQLMAADGGNGKGNAEQQIRAAAQVLASPTANAQQKQSARNLVMSLANQYGLNETNKILMPFNFSIDMFGELRYGADKSQIANWGNQTGGADSNFINPKSAWSKALSDRNRTIQAAANNSGSIQPGMAGGYNKIAGAGGPYSTGLTGSTGDYSFSGQGGDGSGLGGSNDYSGTFFGNVNPKALTELSNQPEDAWGLYLGQGGPGGSSLENTGISKYGQDDFNSAMKLASFFNSGVNPGAEKLNFANNMMGQGTQGGGTYIDPAKVLDAVFSKLGSEPLANQEMVGQALAALQPYMSDSDFQMMMNRVDPVMRKYTNAMLTNGTQDMSGVLLNELQRAIMG